MIYRAIFRCDASPTIGAGHITRCLALGEALVDAGWNVCFVVSQETLGTVPFLIASGINVCVLSETGHEIETIISVARGCIDYLIIDHYGRDEKFEFACRRFAAKIIVFDDGTGRDHDCDVLIDSATTNPTLYKSHVPVHTHVLTGPEFAIVRKAFIARRADALIRRDGRPVRKILVSSGATDPANVTETVLDALRNVSSDITITVALSSRAPNVNAISAQLRENMRLVLDSDDMAGLMTDADLAIGGAGATAWERCCLGLPSVLVEVAEHQRGNVDVITNAGAGVSVGLIDGNLCRRLEETCSDLLHDSERLRDIGRAGAELVDGHGVVRLVGRIAGI